ncbi:MAG: hypothetical protein K0Q48_1012 [Bacillota bacterium]|nr:hypothetical protein [Bacillota bacterium]
MLFLVVFACCLLSSCEGAAKKPTMYLAPAKLSEAEEKLANLLGEDGTNYIYDFKLSDTVKSVQVNTYELKDGAWQLIAGGGGYAFSDERGRLALAFDKLETGMRIALQGEKSNSSTTYASEPSAESTQMSSATSWLQNSEELLYEKEIPLVVQVLTTQNSISAHGLEAFENPEEYAKYGYEHVFAVTIRFSKKSVSELDSEI